MEAPVTRPGLARNFSDGLPAGWSRHQGWFELDKTDVPTADQLAELQKRTGGADALATRTGQAPCEPGFYCVGGARGAWGVGGGGSCAPAMRAGGVDGTPQPSVRGNVFH